MRRTAKLAMAASLTTLFLAVAVGAASGRRIEISSQFVRVTWAELTMEGAGISIRCPMTIEGSFHSRTMSKVCGSVVGLVSRAVITPGSCTGAEVALLQESLPWRLGFIGFTGALPRIQRIRGSLIGLSLRIEALGTACLYELTQTRPGFGEDLINESTGVVTGLRLDETQSVPLKEGGILCPTSGRFAGTATITQQASTTSVTIRLVL